GQGWGGWAVGWPGSARGGPGARGRGRGGWGGWRRAGREATPGAGRRVSAAVLRSPPLPAHPARGAAVRVAHRRAACARTALHATRSAHAAPAHDRGGPRDRLAAGAAVAGCAAAGYGAPVQGLHPRLRRAARGRGRTAHPGAVRSDLAPADLYGRAARSEEHTSALQSRENLV